MFRTEMDIHFPGLGNVNKRPVVVFPEVLVCFNCGTAEFTVPKDELILLAKCDATENGYCKSQGDRTTSIVFVAFVSDSVAVAKN
jgi:hypothetical protein